MNARHRTGREVVAQGWGEDAPPWIIALADERDATSQNLAAERIGFSGSAVSQALSNTYGRPLDNIRHAVERTIMNGPVDCPELGEISQDMCRRFHARAMQSAVGSSLGARMARTCPTCPLRPKKGPQK
ncbi:MAG: hypothetical protein AAGP08_00185 [Pseudomonadota bacterium]